MTDLGFLNRIYGAGDCGNLPVCRLCGEKVD